MGISVLEYGNLSIAAGTGVLDQLATAAGTTGSSPTTVASGATAATTVGNDLVFRLHAHSGFDIEVTPDPPFTQRVDTTPSQISHLLVEDRVSPHGATPNARVTTGPKTVWLMAKIPLMRS